MFDFNAIKQAAPLAEVARRYGLEAGRGGMCRCPFHADKHPSMKLFDDHFRCFGCGEHGDVIDLVARLRGISLSEAAQELERDYCGGSARTKQIPLRRRKPKLTDEERCSRVIDSCLRRLWRWKTSCAPQSPDEEPSDRYVCALMLFDRAEEAAVRLAMGSREDRERTARQMIASGELAGLLAQVNIIKEGIND